MSIAVVDIDGVLADFTHGFSSLTTRLGLTEKSWTCGEQPTWEWGELTEENSSLAWGAVRAGDSFWRNLHPIPSQGEIGRLYVLKSKVDIVYMTGRVGVTSQKQSEDWLHWYGFPLAPVIMETDKLAGILDLNAASPEGRVISIIDDKPDTLLQLTRNNSVQPLDVCTRDWPYNRHIWTTRRVSSLGEWIAGVEELL